MCIDKVKGVSMQVAEVLEEEVDAARSRLWDLQVRHPLHPAPCTLHPAPCTLHPAPYTRYTAPCTLHITPCTLRP